MNNYQQILEQYRNAIRITSYDKESRLLLRRKKEIVAADTETTGLRFATKVIHTQNTEVVWKVSLNVKGRPIKVIGRG